MATGEWMYWVGWMGAIVVVLAMIVMAWWALFSDRPRGRRRCPQCWYDLSYSPGMSCSECGFEASEERQLLHTRRRYGLAGLAAVTTFVVLFNIRHLAVEHGVVSLLPTSVLSVGMAVSDDPSGAIFSEVRRRFVNGLMSESELNAVMNRLIRGDHRARPPDDAWVEKYGRMLRSWRYELALLARDEQEADDGRTALREIEERLTNIPPRARLMTRSDWPEDVPAVALLRINEWWPIGSLIRVTTKPVNPDVPERVMYQSNTTLARSSFSIPLGVLDADITDVEVDVQIDWKRDGESVWKSVWQDRLRVPVRVGGDLADLIAPINTSEINEAMRSTFGGELRRWDRGRSPLRFYYRPDYTRGPAFEDVAIGVALQLIHGDSIVRELHMWWLAGSTEDQTTQRNFGWEIVYEDIDAIRSINLDDPGMTFKVEGRPELALRAGDATYYWNGSFTTPAWFRTRITDGEAPLPEWWITEPDEVDGS